MTTSKTRGEGSPRSRAAAGRTKASALALGAIAAACSSSGGGGGGDASTLVIGIQSEALGSNVDRAHVVTRVNGATHSDETLAIPPGGPSPFPHEVRIEAPNGDASAKVDVSVDVMGTDGHGDGALILTRLASSTFVPGQTRLLRLDLDSRCILAPPGGTGGPACTAPQTCQAGRCADDTVLPSDLEPYGPSWAVDAPDICRPASHGAPEVLVGTGQTDYAPVTDGQTLQPELGPQKGHHLWVAVRMRNLKQSGSSTTITGVQPGTNVAIPPTSFVFTFNADEGGYCKLFGLRYQLDNGGIDYKQFLGKPLDLTVTVHDSLGETSAATAHVQVAPTVLGE